MNKILTDQPSIAFLTRSLERGSMYTAKSKSPIRFEIGKDTWVRKAVELAAADVTLKDDDKATGNVEKLSITVLKGIQDAMHDIARGRQIKAKSQPLAEQYLLEFKESYIRNKVKYYLSPTRNAIGLSQVEAESKALRLYENDLKTIKALAEKRAWVETLQQELEDSELNLWFDAKSIFEYSRINRAPKDKLFRDVEKLQERFNRWSERYFNVETGTVERVEYSSCLLPTAAYYHGSNPKINVKINKDMAHLVLFVSNAYLRFHHESYVKLGRANDIRLYETLVNIVSGNLLFHTGGGLSFEFLQSKFDTNYDEFKDFLSQVITKSLERINEKLGTTITWKIDKKEGRATKTIKFVYSKVDAKILIGDDNISESDLYTFEYYLILYSFGGVRPQGGIGATLEEMRAKLSSGEFDFFGKSKEEIYKAYEDNLRSAEELEALIEQNPQMQEIFSYDHTFLNAIDKQKMNYVGATATDSLEIIKEIYLVPMGMVRPTLPYFTGHTEEKSQIASILPFGFKITQKKLQIVDHDNFENLKASLEPHFNSIERFEFDSEEHKQRFCKVFGITCADVVSEPIEATIIEETSSAIDYSIQDDESEHMVDALSAVGIVIASTNKNKWKETFVDLVKKHGYESIAATIQLLTSNTQEATFWLKNVSTPLKFKKHFLQISHIANIEKFSIAAKIKNDPEIRTIANVMKKLGESDEDIASQIKRMVEKKISTGEYNVPYQRNRRRINKESLELETAMKLAGYTNIFDYIENENIQ